MYADINRKSLDPEKTHFSQLLHHQGRVLLPSDLNEHGAIFQYYLRQFIIDFVGRHWRAGANSFKISDIDTSNKTFKISAGHFYADGILCVNEPDCWYSGNTDIPVQPMFPTPEWDTVSLTFPENFAVYLECWERHVNSIQWPAITEVALGGPDTSSRVQIAWQVRILTSELAKSYVESIKKAQQKSGNTSDCPDIEAKLSTFETAVGSQAQNPCDAIQGLIDLLDCAGPKLRVWAKKPADASQPCSISPDAQFRGLENQLYRVEIHNPGVISVAKAADPTQLPPPSFKWSRENGSVVFRIIHNSLSASSNKITLDVETLGPDRRSGLCVNDWVELTSDMIEFSQKVPPLAKVEKIESNLGRLTLSISPETITGYHLTDFKMLRRWDQNPGSNAINKYGAIDIVEDNGNNYDKDNWILLEQGIKIQFQPGGNYHAGDYWMIPARVATGDVEWPRDDKGIPQPRPTDGVKRHRAALGVVNGKVVDPSCSCTVVPDCEKKT